VYLFGNYKKEELGIVYYLVVKGQSI